MKMLPPYIGKTISNAERKIFQTASSSKELEGWFCLHSLGVSKHIYKREGEIDFLLVGEAGVFIIEVKGGRVHRENGIWKFTDRYGHVTEKRESPFTQAQSAMYSLRADLAQKFGQDINRYLFGYGVALPDITFNTESPEWSLDTVYDTNDTGKLFDLYVARLIESWRSKQRSYKPLSRQNVNEIVQYLRGDFETVVPISVKMEESETELIRLTEEQLSSLDAMEDNPRIMFQGAAGTGKTLLAVERARRNASSGLRTLMLCYNKYLAAYLKEAMETENLQDLITVSTVHSFFYDVIAHAGLRADLETAKRTTDAQQIYSNVYPDLFSKGWNDSMQYDSLIIDEAQDILTASYLRPFSQIIKGGLDNGKWYMFLDPENQKDMFTKLDAEVLNELKKYSTTFTLTVNCRNTKPIAIQTEVLSGIATAKIKKVEGAPVQYIWYENESEQAIKVSDAVNKVLSDGIQGGDITLLSPLRYSSSIAGTGRLRLKAPLYPLDADNIASKPRDRIAYTSIQSFKGLESPVVVITDITELDSDWDRIVNYVGLTRARTALIVAAKHELKVEYRHRLKKLLESK
jgi:superfamily I DNA/RNA helicase